MKVLLKIYSVLNWGDDMFAYIVAKRYPKVKFEIKVWGDISKYDRFAASCPNIAIRAYENLPARIFRKLGMEKAELIADSMGYKALVWVGGSLFIESDKTDYQALEKLRRMIRLFRKRGVYVLCVNFGPYRTEGFLSLCREIFTYCRDICFREQYSYEMFRDLPAARLGADAGFLMRRERRVKPGTLGISLIDLDIRPKLTKYKKEYFAFLKRLAQENEGETTLFCFCVAEGDRKAAEALAAEIGAGVKIREYVGDIEEFADDWLSMEKVVATRFHSILLSAANGVECIPVIHSEKTAHVITDMSLYKNAVRIGEKMEHRGYEVAVLPEIDTDGIFRAIDERFGRNDL